MTAKDFAALTSKGGASEFKLPDEKKKKRERSAQNSQTRRLGASGRDLAGHRKERCCSRDVHQT